MREEGAESEFTEKVVRVRPPSHRTTLLVLPVKRQVQATKYYLFDTHDGDVRRFE
jgi:hypothetical protein